MDTGAAIVTAALLASIGWIFGQRQNRKLTRFEHTFQVLNSYRHDESHWAALAQVIVLAKNENIPKPEESGRQADIEALRKLLIHYEFIAVGIFSGGLDEGLIRECDRSNIVNVHKCSRDFIAELRTTRGRNTIYRNLQDIAERWEAGSPGYFERVIEFILMRPYRRQREGLMNSPA